MHSEFLYPALVSADWHIHGRGNRGRLAEADALCSWIIKTQNGLPASKKFKSLVLSGDILDRGGALPVPIILRLAEMFRMFPQVWIVVGNHDTPLRNTAVTQLDLFSLCGAVVIKEPTIVGSVLFLPYYTEMPKDVPATVKNVFAHKDIREYNTYFDAEWAASVVDFPPHATVFNGHLHAAAITQHSAYAHFVQMGSPYPCTWGDAYEKNQWLWLVEENSYKALDALCITGDAGKSDSPLYMFIRSRDTSESDDEVIDERAIVAALAAAEDGRLSIDQALASGRVGGRVGKIVKAVVNRVATGVEGVRL